MLIDCDCYCQLRNYPEGFGRAISDMFEELRTSARGCPVPPEDLPPGPLYMDPMHDDLDAEEIFANAGLEDVYVYLRGALRLEIPEVWRPLVPAPERLLTNVPPHEQVARGSST